MRYDGFPFQGEKDYAGSNNRTRWHRFVRILGPRFLKKEHEDTNFAPKSLSPSRARSVQFSFSCA
jgi:hypothetical protein